MSGYSIIWSDKALKQLDSIYEFIAKDSPKTAFKIINLLFNEVEILPTFPTLGKIDESLKFLKQDHRFLIKGNYKIVYHINDEVKVIVINVVFDARQNPDNLKYQLQEK